MAEIVPYPIMPAPSPYERRVSVTAPTTGTDETKTTLSDEQKAALEGSAAVATQEEDQIRREQAGKNAIADAESQGITDQQRIADWEAAQANSPAAIAANEYIAKVRQHTQDEEGGSPGFPRPPCSRTARDGTRSSSPWPWASGACPRG